MKGLDAKAKKDLANAAIYWLSRPYVLAFALVFVFTPSFMIARAIESGADFLNIGAGARASGMGSAYTAVTGDASSIYYNPAGLAYGNKKELSFMHAGWLLGGSYDFAAFALPMKGWNSAFSFTRLDHGSFESRGAGREAGAGFGASDKAVALGVGRRLGNGLSVGLGAKFIQSEIAGYGAETFAFDLGIVRSLSSLPLSFGASVRNLGPGLKYLDKRDPLPLSISAGASLRALSVMNVVVDIKRLVFDRQTDFSVGTEYAVFGPMALRGGYGASLASAGTKLAGLSGGFGLKLGNMQLDYSFTPFGDLDTTKKLGLSCKF